MVIFVGGILYFSMYLFMELTKDSGEGVPIGPGAIYLLGEKILILGILLFLVDCVLRIIRRLSPLRTKG